MGGVRGTFRNIGGLLALVALVGLVTWVLRPRTRDGAVVATAGVAAAPLPPETPGRRRIAGTVRTEDGAPVAGAAVSVRGAPATATTRADGTYALETERDIVYLLHASAQGYAAITLVMEDAPDVHADFRMHVPAPLFGRVVDQDGLPVRGAALSAKLVADESERLFDQETDENGAFRFEDAHAGQWWLEIDQPRDGDWAGNREMLVSPADGPLLLTLRRGEGRTVLTLDIVDATTGKPLPFEKRVGLYREELVGRMCWRNVETEPGRIVAHGLGAGRWQLELKTPFGPVTRSIDIEPGAEEVRRRVEVGPPGSIVGSVDIEDVVAFPGVLVLSTHPTEGRIVEPADGKFHELAFLGAKDGYAFRLEDVRSGMPLDLIVRTTNVLGHASVTVRPGGVEQVAIKLHRTGTLEFRFAHPPPVRTIVLKCVPAGEEDWWDWHVAFGVPTLRVDLPTGPARWSVRWPDPRDGTPMVREGDANVRAGAVTVVDADLK